MKGQFNSARPTEIILAWKPRLTLANSRGTFEESDFNSSSNYLRNFPRPEETLKDFFLAIQRNDPHLAADLAQKILLEEESLEVKS